MSEKYTDPVEKYNVNINYHGLDVTVLVDIEMANILLNDPLAAEEYVRNLLKNPSEITEPEDTEGDEGQLKAQVPVWTNKKPTDLDYTATVAFLNLREKYSEQFDDKKTRKSSLWGIIGNELMDMGFYLGETKRDIIEKLRQKFANLQKQYLAYVKHMGTTGESRKEPPAYYNEMHSILGLKDKVNPKNMQDSLEENEPSENTESETEDNIMQTPSTSTQVQNRFSSVNRARPLSVNQQILSEIKSQHVANLEEKRRQFEVLENNLQIQKEQRDRMLENFDRFLDILGGKKRKREDAYSE